jgi:hypothetical protein
MDLANGITPEACGSVQVSCIRDEDRPYLDWLWAAYISLCSGMPQNPKVVCITAGRAESAQHLPRVLQLPSRPGEISRRIEIWRSPARIDLVVRTGPITPVLHLPKTAARKPVQPIPIRQPTTSDRDDPS